MSEFEDDAVYETNIEEGIVFGEDVHKILAADDQYLPNSGNPYDAAHEFDPPHYPGSENISEVERGWSYIDSLEYCAAGSTEESDKWSNSLFGGFMDAVHDVGRPIMDRL